MDQDTDMMTGRPIRDEYLQDIARNTHRRDQADGVIFSLIAGLFRMLPRDIRRFVLIAFALVVTYMLFGQIILGAIHR
jgi:hypothetical protein